MSRPATAATGRRPTTWPPHLAAKGHAVSLHQGNVGKPEDCERVVAEVIDQHGQIDYLINNAGITVDKTVRNMTVEDWHAVLRVNLSGAFYMSKAVLEHMIGRGFGRIVNISSIIGETGNIGQANYAASKSGLFGLTKSLALETARRGITVNCVAPGIRRHRDGRGGPRRRHSTRSSPPFRCAGWVAPRRSPTPFASCSRTKRLTSPAP